MVFIVRPEGSVLDAAAAFSSTTASRAAFENRQAVGLFVLGDAEHSGHPPLKQGGKLPVHRVDLGAGLFQCVHPSTSFG